MCGGVPTVPSFSCPAAASGFVTVEEEKMSKSLGNFFTIRDVLQRYHPMALRWLLLGTHYRAPINYSKVGSAT